MGAYAMHAKCQAFVVHRTPCRLRIKIHEWRRQEAYFAALQRALLEHADVLEVDVNPLVTSVVIRCRPSFNLAASANWLRGVEVLSSEESSAANRQPLRAAAIDEPIRALSNSEFGLAFLLIKLLVAVVTKQLSMQLIDWIVDALLYAATYQTKRTAPRSRSLAPAQPLLLPAA
jgi:hypothetical protein